MLLAKGCERSPAQAEPNRCHANNFSVCLNATGGLQHQFRAAGTTPMHRGVVQQAATEQFRQPGQQLVPAERTHCNEVQPAVVEHGVGSDMHAAAGPRAIRANRQEGTGDDDGFRGTVGM